LLLAEVQKGFEVQSGLDRLQRPVLILQGREDPTGEETAELIHRLIVGSEVTLIDGSGHFPWIERPAEVARVLSEFLNRK
jgi:proline iminopeptidase